MKDSFDPTEVNFVSLIEFPRMKVRVSFFDDPVSLSKVWQGEIFFYEAHHRVLERGGRWSRKRVYVELTRLSFVKHLDY